MSGYGYNGEGIGSDYYDYDDLINACENGSKLQGAILDLGKTNDVFRWIFILLFIYGLIFAFLSAGVAIHYLNERYKH